MRFYRNALGIALFGIIFGCSGFGKSGKSFKEESKVEKREIVLADRYITELDVYSAEQVVKSNSREKDNFSLLDEENERVIALKSNLGKRVITRFINHRDLEERFKNYMKIIHNSGDTEIVMYDSVVDGYIFDGRDEKIDYFFVYENKRKVAEGDNEPELDDVFILLTCQHGKEISDFLREVK